MMKKILLTATVIMSVSLSLTAQKKSASIKKTTTGTAISPMKNSLDSFSYAVGISVASNMKQQGVEKINTTLMHRAIDEIFGNKPLLLTKEQANMKLQEQMAAYAQKKAAAQKEKENVFFSKNKMRKEIIALPDGLQYEILKAGDPNGIKPKVTDTVVVNYKGQLVDGKEFDNSFKRGQPATFPVNGVIKGWTEILQLMTKGAHWKVYIPSELGYGERGAGHDIPGGSILIFEIILEDIKPSSK